MQRARRAWLALLLPILVVAAALAAYLPSFAGVFLFDDRLHILGDRRITVLWPLWETLARKRPVVDFSLAVNYALSGKHVFAYHAVNLTIHILAALTLLGIVRRTLLREPFRARYHGSAAWFALTVALIWVLHPLQTQSVTYLVQRAESLMGLFYLLTLYCVLRGIDVVATAGGSTTPADPISGAPGGPLAGDRVSARRRGWYVAAVVCCALGMGSKAVMVTAPVVILLYDRVFVSQSFPAAVRRRAFLYVGLVATWGVLWMNGLARGVLSTTTQHANVGFGYKGATPWQYARTQCGVLVEYGRLSLWPNPLCLDYVWPLAKTTGDFLATGLVIVSLLGLVTWAVLRGRPQSGRRGRSAAPSMGFAGAWSFIILAPTSSFVPIKDALFEHRMYLPLAGVVVLVVFGAHEALRWIGDRLSWGVAEPLCGLRGSWTRVGLALVVITALGVGTYRRNTVYQSEAGMWRDVRDKRPHSARAAENLGTALLAEGRMDEAMIELRSAVQIAPNSAEVRNGLGFVLIASRQFDEAIESFREALRLKPTHRRARINLGNALADTGRVEEAMREFRTALRFRPKYSEARLNLGNALLSQGRVDEAIEAYRRILRDEPAHASAWGNLGSALLNKGSLADAIDALKRALQANPDSHNAHNSLGIALASQHELHGAIEEFRRALKLKPDLGGAHFNLGNCLVETGDVNGAVRHYRKALAIQPTNVDARYELGVALNKQGKVDEAAEQFRQALQIKPDHAAAAAALEAALATRGQP